MRSKVFQTSQNLKCQFPLVPINGDNQGFTIHFNWKGENLVTSYPSEMRKLFLSCLTLEQDRKQEGLCEMFGFFPPSGELFVVIIAQNMCCFYSSAPEPDCLGHLLPPSGARASVLTFMQPQPLNLPFLQRPACTLQSHTCPGHTLHPSMEKRERKRSLVLNLSLG